MASFLEDLLKTMKNAPHVGIPKVTNPKVPTKVERDAAEYAARERAKPKADYGSGSSFDQLMQRIANGQHPSPRFGDPAFNCNPLNMAAYNNEVEAFMADLRAKKAARKEAKLAAKNEETLA